MLLSWKSSFLLENVAMPAVLIVGVVAMGWQNFSARHVVAVPDARVLAHAAPANTHERHMVDVQRFIIPAHTVFALEGHREGLHRADEAARGRDKLQRPSAVEVAHCVRLRGAMVVQVPS